MKSRYDFDATIRQQLDLQIFHLKLPCQPRGYMHLDVDAVAWSSLICIWWYTLFALSVHKRLGNGKEGLDFEHKFCCHISYHRTAKDYCKAQNSPLKTNCHSFARQIGLLIVTIQSWGMKYWPITSCKYLVNSPSLSGTSPNIDFRCFIVHERVLRLAFACLRDAPLKQSSYVGHSVVGWAIWQMLYSCRIGGLKWQKLIGHTKRVK